jgi:hypothetical protein
VRCRDGRVRRRAALVVAGARVHRRQHAGVVRHGRAGRMAAHGRRHSRDGAVAVRAAAGGGLAGRVCTCRVRRGVRAALRGASALVRQRIAGVVGAAAVRTGVGGAARGRHGRRAHGALALRRDVLPALVAAAVSAARGLLLSASVGRRERGLSGGRHGGRESWWRGRGVLGLRRVRRRVTARLGRVALGAGHDGGARRRRRLDEGLERRRTGSDRAGAAGAGPTHTWRAGGSRQRAARAEAQRAMQKRAGAGGKRQCGETRKTGGWHASVLERTRGAAAGGEARASGANRRSGGRGGGPEARRGRGCAAVGGGGGGQEGATSSSRRCQSAVRAQRAAARARPRQHQRQRARLSRRQQRGARTPAAEAPRAAPRWSNKGRPPARARALPAAFSPWRQSLSGAAHARRGSKTAQRMRQPASLATRGPLVPRAPQSRRALRCRTLTACRSLLAAGAPSVFACAPIPALAPPPRARANGVVSRPRILGLGAGAASLQARRASRGVQGAFQDGRAWVLCSPQQART